MRTDPSNFTFQLHLVWTILVMASQVVVVVKNLPTNTRDIRDAGLLSELRRSLGGGHGNPLQYPCLESPVDRASWQATVPSVTRNWT